MTQSSPEIAIILGTRPEIIKLSPVIRACERYEVEYSIIHTGQHYSDELDTVFFDQLELPTPEFRLDVGSGTHGEQTGAMLAEIENVLLDIEPGTVLVQGDTNSVLAGALATSKLNADLGHVEAGLRSFDREMPEETNRVLTDHASDYLFAPTETAREYLQNEGIADDNIYVTGNTIVDAVNENRQLASEKSTVFDECPADPNDYVLLTAHRAENVDERGRFIGILTGAGHVARKLDTEIIYPIHPRARDRIEEFELDIPEGISLIEPQDYLDFLALENGAKLVMTDSGGVQEEACILGVPCVTLRDNTERPETIENGANRLVGTDPESIVTGSTQMLDAAAAWENPFGDGTAAEQIIEIVSDTSKQHQTVNK